MNLRPALRYLVFALLAVFVITSVSDAHALRRHVRDGWMVGLGVGYGSASAVAGTDSPLGESGQQIDLKRGTAPQFRVGRDWGSKFGLHVDYTGWLIESGNTEEKFRLSFQNIGLALNWYPGGEHPAWGGIILRAGAGYGWGSAAEVPLFVNDDGELEGAHGTRGDEGGFGVVLSAGYEFRLVEHFAVGVGFNLHALSIDKQFYESAATYPVTINGSWYW